MHPQYQTILQCTSVVEYGLDWSFDMDLRHRLHFVLLLCHLLYIYILLVVLALVEETKESSFLLCLAQLPFVGHLSKLILL